MDASAPPTSVSDNVWDKAQRRADLWRGAMIRSFARTEGLVSEILLQMHSCPEHGDKIELQRMTGQRLRDLTDAIAEAGPFAAAGKPARSHLASFKTHHDTWRALICHADGEIAVDRKSKWLLGFELLIFTSGKYERRWQAISEDGAKVLLEEVQKASHDLGCTLGQLRKAISGKF